MGRGRNKRAADQAEQPQAAENDAAVAGAGLVHVHWDQHKLAERWETDKFLRKRGRQNKCLTIWSSSKTIGIATLKGIYLNSHALLHLAKLWCPLVPVAKSPPIPVLNPEAGHVAKLCSRCLAVHPYILETLGHVWQVIKWREEMLLPEDDVMVYRDQWGLRRLFSLAIRRRGAPRRKRDALVDEFFEILERHWGKTWKPSRRRSSKSVDTERVVEDDDDEEAAVDPDQLSDAEESAGLAVEVHPADTDAYGGGVDDPIGGGAWSDSEEKPPHHLSLLAACASDSEEKPPPPTVADLGQQITDDVDGVEMDLEEQLLLEEIMLLKTSSQHGSQTRFIFGLSNINNQLGRVLASSLCPGPA